MADETVLTNEPTTGGLSSAVGAAPSPAPMATASPTARDVGAIPQPAPDLPRFQRTFGNTLKSMLIGFGMGGVPGAAIGAIDPEGVQQARANRQAKAQAEVTFANARAAHEVAMAHQADAEYQALPGKLQDEADARGLENLKRAREAGYLPVATVPLDQGKDQNSQGAKTALDEVKTKFGAVPSGMLYVHTGNSMTVLKLQDPNAALPMINQARRAQGMPEIDTAAFATLDPKDRDSMARDAINFTDPRDVNGTITQNSLNQANLRLANVKGQPEFNGKDALVTQLQATVDHQKDVLASGAKEAGARAGAEKQAAEPGETAAKISEQTALSQTPTGKLETAQKRANLAQTQATTAKTRAETANLGEQPIFAVDPATNERVMTTRPEAKAKGYTNPVPVKEGDVSKETDARAMINDVQLNKSRYLSAMDRMYSEPMTGAQSTALIALTPEKLGVDFGHFFSLNVPDVIQKVTNATAFSKLSNTQKQAVVGYYSTLASVPAAQKALTNIGRSNKEMMDLELRTIPPPIVDQDSFHVMLDRFQGNIDQTSHKTVRMPGMPSTKDIRNTYENTHTPFPPMLKSPEPSQ